jgi:hypothetical protein
LIRGRLGLEPEENAALARLVRDAWSEGPGAPSVESLMRALQPGLARVDAEIREGAASRSGWREVLRSLLAPVAVGGLAGGAAVAALALLMVGRDADLPTSARTQTEEIATVRADFLSDASPISDLESESPLLVFEGEDGSTVIWIMEGSDDLSHRALLVGADG